MKLFAIYLTNYTKAYGGVQPLRRALSLVFAYDGNGMRFRKVVNNATTECYYNGDQLIMESRNKEIFV